MKMNLLRGILAIGVIAGACATAKAAIVAVPNLNCKVELPDDWRLLTQEELETLRSQSKRHSDLAAAFVSKDGTMNMVAFQNLPAATSDPKTHTAKIQASLPAGVTLEWDEKSNFARGRFTSDGVTDRVYAFYGGKAIVVMHCIAPTDALRSTINKHESMASSFRFDSGYARGEYSWITDNMGMILTIGSAVAVVLFFRSRRNAF